MPTACIILLVQTSVRFSEIEGVWEREYSLNMVSLELVSFPDHFSPHGKNCVAKNGLRTRLVWNGGKKLPSSLIHVVVILLLAAVDRYND